MRKAAAISTLYYSSLRPWLPPWILNIDPFTVVGGVSLPVGVFNSKFKKIVCDNGGFFDKCGAFDWSLRNNVEYLWDILSHRH